MDRDGALWIRIMSAADPRRSAERAFVLEALGIRYWQERVGTGVDLYVHEDDAERAVAELADYDREHPARAAARPAPTMFGSAWPGIAAYVTVLVLVAGAARQYAFGLEWYPAGRMESGPLLGGEWWRAVTALTLHLDLDHLLANVAFGCFFAYFVARYLGGGVGWLAIVCAGSLGNVLNALMQPPSHRSIGASTAVFAALAILAANTWRRGWSADLPLRTRVAPIFAAVALLAYTGAGGANTDIGAHLMGFVAGLGVGLALASVDEIKAAAKQRAAAIAAAALVASAWIWGLAAAG